MDHPRRTEIALVVLIVALGACFARAAYIPPFADRHVALASEKYDIDFGTPPKWFSAWSIGDGQAFAVIAADPTGGKLGEEIREPAYRFARAGFGWLAALMSLGEETWIPYGMALVGALAIVGNLLLAVKLRPRLGPKAWFLILNPAIYLGFAGDTAESLGALLLTASLAFGSVMPAIALGVTRPTYLIALWGRWRQLGAGVAAAMLLALYSLLRFGLEQFVAVPGALGPPLLAYLESPTGAGLLLAGLALATSLIGVRRRAWPWVITGVFVLCAGPNVTPDPINAWRAAGPLLVLWAFGPSHEPMKRGAPSETVSLETAPASV